ncbi:MAG TPA: hypothetical protein VKU41_29260 [Polyangiaceae bacterium]|nr:hypothetical protein [Polyangiaceae bacterium]
MVASSMEVSALQPTGPTQEVSPVASPQTRPAAPPPAAAGVSATISRAGELLSRMQQLAQKDPSRFTSVAMDASQALQAASASESGDKARSLKDLASGFAQAASTGSPAPVHRALARAAGHGRHRHGRAGPSIASTSSPMTDKAQAALSQVSEQVDQALGLSTAPMGPWLPRQS